MAQYFMGHKIREKSPEKMVIRYSTRDVYFCALVSYLINLTWHLRFLTVTRSRYKEPKFLGHRIFSVTFTEFRQVFLKRRSNEEEEPLFAS
jgi:hypothetical protein